MRFLFAIALALSSTLLAADRGGPPPGVIIDTSPDFATVYIGSPSIAILPDGTYVASHDWFGKTPLQGMTVILASTDKGKTWSKRAEFPFFWGNLFVHRDALYILGTLRSPYGAKATTSYFAIRRSTDGGRTWTDPVDSKSGLLRTDAPYHTAPCPVVVYDGRIWRAIESSISVQQAKELGRPIGGGDRMRAVMASAPEASDLLDAANWTLSEGAHFERTNWFGSLFIEGNAVLTPENTIVNIIRVNPDGRDKAVILDCSADGTKLTSRGPASQIDFPGGAVKFTIRFDPKSGKYWSIVSKQREPNATRNVLVLSCSKDLIHWEVRTILHRHYDWQGHGWQYIDWVFEGDDILYVSRTAWDGAHNFHDANYMTFHRIKDFRNKSSKDDTPWLGRDTMKSYDAPRHLIEGTFDGIGTFDDGQKTFANRDYVWGEVPEKYKGWKFTRLRGGVREAIRLTMKEDGWIYLITAPNVNLPGWTEAEPRAFYYSDSAKTRPSIFHRGFKKGDRIDLPQPTWIGGILLFQDNP